MAEKNNEKKEIRNRIDEPKNLPIGLTGSEAEERMKQYGKNVIYQYMKTSEFELFASQFSIPIVVLILAALFLATVNLMQGLVVILIIMITIVTNWLRNRESEEKIIRNMKEFYGQVKAYRDGKIVKLSIEEIVPGDMLILEKGMLVPADGIVIKAKECKVDENIFQRGIVEKVPEMEVEKTFKPYKSDPSSLYAGTFIKEGECTMRVTGTGKSTKYYISFGAKSILSMDPRKNDSISRVKKATDSFGGVVYLASVVILLQLVADGMPIFNAIVIAAAAAVAAIPDTISSVASYIYSSTIERMSKFAVIRRDAIADKIGRTSILVTEMFRSLTRNEPTVRNLWIDRKEITVTGDGWDVLGVFKGTKNYASIDMMTEMVAAATEATFVYNNDTMYLEGDPIEGALVTMAMKNRIPINNIRGEWILVEKRYENGITISKIRKKNRIAYVMFGPSEQIKEKCKSLYSNGKFLKIDEKINLEIEMQEVKMAANGQKTYAIAFAWKRNEPKYFTFLALAGIYDPPKPEVKRAISELKNAGIKPIIITSAKSGEAVSFAKEIGIMGETDKAVICEELKYLRPEERTKRILGSTVFSESTGEYEAMILDVFKKEGHHVTYMESIGTDYAPFMYTNVSLAVESAPDIIKNNSDAIIRNDRYESTIDLIEESRDMRRNIERSFYALSASDMSIFFIIMISAILFTGDMMTATQILLINLIADVAIATNFSREKLYEKSLGTKTSKRFPETGEYVAMLMIALSVSVYFGVLTLLPIFDGYNKTVAIATLSVAILAIMVNSISIKDNLLESLRHVSADTILAICLTFAILFAAFYLPFVSSLFELKPLSLMQWLYIAPVAIIITLVSEIKKILLRKK
ncbi:MAG: cation transporting ATPase C-terminal domain-containing protein [Candidatus Micrarchaeota archaeon]|nr:cation transporting ATPase C-terminal domain-containing protein [Candidatus Micrarchaeota archaeon]